MLQSELAQQGQRMYRWRGFLPLLLIPVIAFGFRHYHYFFGSHRLDQLWELLCLGFAFFGLMIRFVVFGYSPPGSSHVGQSTLRPDTKKLKTTGVYSLCRNPLYLGNFFMGFGVLLFLESLVVMVVYALIFALYYERLILAEEAFLRRAYGAEYADWAAQTPLIFPRLSSWRRPGYPFSWRVAVRREYKRIFGVIAVFMLMEVVGDLIVEGRWEIDPGWAVLFSAGLAFYVSVRLLKRFHLIDVPSR